MAPAAAKASLIAHLRASGRNELAAALDKLSPSQVQEYLADFARRHAPAVQAIREGASPAEAMAIEKAGR